MQVPIDSVPVPERVRKDLGDLQPLMDSLKRVGQLHPIRLTPTYQNEPTLHVALNMLARAPKQQEAFISYLTSSKRRA